MGSFSIDRKSLVSTLVVAVVALVVVLGSAVVYGAGPVAAATQGAGVTAASGPLAQVSTATFTPQAAAQASAYGYTVTPDPAALNSNHLMTVLVSVGSEQGLNGYVQQV